MSILAEAVPTDSLRSLNVLYVEDDPEIRRQLAIFLRRRVGNLLVAENGQQGLAQFKLHNPDVVITDIVMPLMDGLEMAEAIKRLNKEIPVIVTTAFNDQNFFITAIEVGIDHYVLKPIDTDALLEAVRKAAKSILQQREIDNKSHALQLASMVFENSAEGILVTDLNSEIISTNRALSLITGYSAAETIGRKPSLFKSDRHDANFYQAMRKKLEQDHCWQGEIWNRRKSGELFPAWLSISAVMNPSGKVTNYVGMFIDFTERKQAEDEIHHLAFYDMLTQLPNRRLLLDRLRQAVSASVRTQNSGALLFIDLDNFKSLNDTKGHAVGDLLLIEVARRLQACMRPGDTLARFGGDEFVLLLEGLGEDKTHAAILAQAVAEEMFQAISQTFILDGHEVHSSSSIGITLFANHQQNVDELLKQADTAMYEAKKSGRNALRFFDPRMQEQLEIRARLEAGLRDALHKQQLRLYYQMQVNQKGQLLGAEVLLRWIHPEQGLISPLQFIPMAEETGLILPIGAWVLENACQQLKAWELNQNTRNMHLSVNVSAKQFRQIDFVAQVREILARSGVNPMRLKLELTESIVLDDVADTIIKMQALRETGVSFSMDDFGTGYSSLSYLTQLPLNQLKIDQSFVRNIGAKASDAIIIQTIIGMANNLSMEVIAEGVETTLQRNILEGMGCLYYQGYLYGVPMSLESFLQEIEFTPSLIVQS